MRRRPPTTGETPVPRTPRSVRILCLVVAHYPQDGGIARKWTSTANPARIMAFGVGPARRNAIPLPMESGYKYETHLHTCETSRCAESSGAEYARHYKALGYAGVFVTDHFLNANTTVPQDLPWTARVARFCLGYEETAREGAKLGLDVFFGWEYAAGWAHFLTYGLGKDWLLAHPDVLDWKLLDYFDRVHRDGGLIVHAHPFREEVELVTLVPGKVDAVEVVNGSRSDASNRHALDFARSYRLPQTVGSDIHSTGVRRLCGVRCPRRLGGARDYLAAIVSGDAALFDDALHTG